MTTLPGSLWIPIPFIVYEERACLKGQYQNLIFTVLGAAVVTLLTVLRTKGIGFGAINFLDLGPAQCGYLTIVGTLTISAMLLPGISSSMLLLILGISAR